MSQLLGAFASHVAANPAVTAVDLADGLVAASEAADTAVLRPVEGTILTVARAAAAAASEHAPGGAALADVAEAARSAAAEALERTPELLPELRAAGVMDAGGTGFLLLLDALVHVLTSRPLPVAPVVARSSPPRREPEAHRFEVVVRLAVAAGDLDEFRGVWRSLGNESTVVVAGEGWWLAHIHTDHPEAAMEAARTAGSVLDVHVTDLAAQIAELTSHQAVQARTAVVAVAAGAGIIERFRELGAAATLVGPPVRDPAVGEVLDVIDACDRDDVVVLPNDDTTLVTVDRARRLTSRIAAVVPTRTMVEGLMAMQAFTPGADAASNAAQMEAAVATVRSGGVTPAVRDAATAAGPVRIGDWIGLGPDVAPVIAATAEDAVEALVETLGAADPGRLLLVSGHGADPVAAAALPDRLRQRWPSVRIEVMAGAQPRYPYLVGYVPDPKAR
jgi:DAK2 domain fusion protein YloV